MKAWHCFPIFGILIFSHTGCCQTRSVSDIATKVDRSVVLINYKDRGGHGTGFFVSEDQANCTVLTARHVVAASDQLKLHTNDHKTWEIEKIQRFPHHDLALLTFTPEGNRCPYPALKIGDSNAVKRAQRLYISGYYNSGGRLLHPFIPGDVIAIDNLPNGYGIAYQATTTKGMSGSPVVNLAGEVVAVHGRSDVEVTKIDEIQSFSDSQLQSSEGEPTIAKGAKIATFKWGIPINLYLDNQDIAINSISHNSFLPFLYKSGITSKILWYLVTMAILLIVMVHKVLLITITRKKLEQSITNPEEIPRKPEDLNRTSLLQPEIASYDRVSKPNDANVWFSRGYDLGESDRHEEAIAAYDRALAIKPNDAAAWNNRGIALHKLYKYEDALKSSEQALAIKPDSDAAWNSRGVALHKLDRYQEAIASYDQALVIKPNNEEAWNNRGAALEHLGKYQEALDSYNKAIEINLSYTTAINNRQNILKKLPDSNFF